MADSSYLFGLCSKVGGGSLGFGINAGVNHASGTGGIYIGYQAGMASSSGPQSIAIGANCVIGTTAGDCIAIGAGASLRQGSAASNSIALGYNAASTALNTIVLGTQVTVVGGSTIYGDMVREYGRGHQYFWTVTTANSSLVLTGTTGAASIKGGWIAFESITANATLTLPSLTDLLAVLPDMIEGSFGEMILSNYNTGGWTISVTQGTDTFWYNTVAMVANTIQHVKYRYVTTSGWQQATPFIEFFS